MGVPPHAYKVAVIFVLLGADENVLEPLVQQTFASADQIKVGPAQWLVYAEGSATSKDMWTNLVTGVVPPPEGIMFPVANGYFGLAPSSVWEWIATKRQTAALL